MSIKHGFIQLLALFIGLLLTLTLLLITPWGLKLSLAAIGPRLGSTIVIKNPWSVKGTFFDLHNLNLEVHTHAATLSFNDVAIAWNPLTLFDGKITINTLRVQQLSVQGTTRTHPAPQSSFGYVPPLIISTLHVNTLLLNANTSFGSLDGNLSINDTQHLTLNITHTQPAGQSRAHLNLALTAPYALSAHIDTTFTQHGWQLKLPLSVSGTLNRYQLNATGALSAHGHHKADINIHSQGDAQSFTAHLQAKAANSTLESTFDLHFTDTPSWQLSLETNPWSINTLRHFTGQTTPSTDKTASTPAQSIRLALKASGRYDMTRHHMSTTLNTVNLHTPYGLWQLKAPVAFAYPLSDQQTHQGCLVQHDASLCLNIRRQKKGLHLRLASNHLSLAQLDTIQTHHTLAGTLQLHADFSNQDGTWHSHGQIDVDHFRLKHHGHHRANDHTLLSLAKSTFTFTEEKHVLRAQLAITQHADNTFNAEILLPQTQSLQNMAMDVSAHIDFANMRPFQPLLPGFFEPKAHITGNVRLFGPLFTPTYQGELHIQHIQTLIPTLGVNITDGNIDIINPSNHHFDVQGQLFANKAPLTVNGKVTLIGYQPRLSLNIHGNHFPLVDLPNTKVIASPNISFQQQHDQLSLKGSILIDQANLSPRSFQINSDADSDVRYVHQTSTSPLNLSENLRLIMGDNVHFNGFGINTYVQGKLRLSNAHGKSPLLASGTLTSGKKPAFYETHGKRFNIQKGELIFAQSPISNPRLNISATYELPPGRNLTAADNITLGVNVLGTLAEPEITLFSTPTMSQEDIFSYIVLGKPLSDVNDNNKSALSQAAALFALNGGSQTIVSNIQHTLGLNELTLGTLEDGNLSDAPSRNTTNNDTTRNVAVFLGKSLLPWLYVSYGKGLFNGSQLFQAKIYLSRHLELRGDLSWQSDDSPHTAGDSSDQAHSLNTGADIFYQFSR